MNSEILADNEIDAITKTVDIIFFVHKTVNVPEKLRSRVLQHEQGMVMHLNPDSGL